jgi:cytochrome c553
MKKLTLMTLALVLTAGSVMAGIEVTPHNLSVSQPDLTLFAAYSAWNEDEICVFCHTPHGGSLDAPLWNRDHSAINGTSYYTHYNSDTISSVISTSQTRAVNGPSLSCLSCHDGSIGVGDNLLNLSGPQPDNDNKKIPHIFNADLGIDVPGPKVGAIIGDVTSTTNLSDDHPISFSYSDVLTEKGTGAFQSVAYVTTTQGLTLYGGNVECATCHDPHVDYIADPTLDPFLRISNAGSAMCLSCHKK